MIAVGPELEHTKVTIITRLWSHPPNTYTTHMHTRKHSEKELSCNTPCLW